MNHRVEHEEGEPRIIRGVPRLSQEELRQLVLDLLSGQALSTDQVDTPAVKLVFMPLAMGALSPPEELREALMGSTSPPETLDGDPPKPEFPGYPQGPGDPPEKPVLGKLNPQVLRDLEWGEVDEDMVAEAQEILDVENTRRIQAWEDASREWHEALDAVASGRSRIEAKHDLAVKAWQAALIVHTGRAEARQRLYDEWVERHDRIFSRWSEDIGAIVGNMKDTFPRAINGYPMFHAIQTVHKDDWTRVRKAVEREQTRQRKLEV